MPYSAAGQRRTELKSLAVTTFRITKMRLFSYYAAGRSVGLENTVFTVVTQDNLLPTQILLITKR
jgi:hypothetical protein